MTIDWRANLADPRTLLLLAALGLASTAIVLPPLPVTRDGVDVLAVVDITWRRGASDPARSPCRPATA